MSPVLAVLLVVVVVVLGIALLRARRRSNEAERATLKVAQDRQRLLAFMHLMTEALGEGLSPQELQQRIVHAAIVCTGALSGCFFVRTERDTMRSVAVEGLFPPHRPLTDDAKHLLTTRSRFIEHVLKAEEFPISEGVVGRVARLRKGELLADAAADETIVKHDDPALMVRSVIVVPLQFRERFFGVLAVTNPATGARFTTDDFGLLEALAEQAGLALHNAESLHLQIEKQQLDLDLAIAVSIQQMLLPRESVRIEHVEVNARYMPAKQIGGDLYDVFRLDANRLAIVVADVSGKGMAASLVMAICRTNLRQIAPRFESPAEVLRELNRVMQPDMQSGLFITLVYAVIDVSEDKLTLARAGHELPLMVQRDAVSGSVVPRWVSSEGIAVGLVPDAMFADAILDRTERFGVGDLLVLYTDGLTEMPNEDGREFSNARLADAVRAGFDGPTAAVNDRIIAAVEAFAAGEPQRDDFTLVTVRRI